MITLRQVSGERNSFGKVTFPSFQISKTVAQFSFCIPKLFKVVVQNPNFHGFIMRLSQEFRGNGGQRSIHCNLTSPNKFNQLKFMSFAYTNKNKWSTQENKPRYSLKVVSWHNAVFLIRYLLLSLSRFIYVCDNRISF